MGEGIAAGLDIASESHINRERADFSFPNYRRHSFNTVVNGSPYLGVDSMASADSIAPTIGADFFEDQIDC